MGNYCSNCGTEVDEGTSYCPNCGEDVGDVGIGGIRDRDDEGGSEGDSVEADESEGFDVVRALTAGAIGLIPAFGAYMLISIARNDPLVPVLFLGIPVFGYLLYKRPTTKAMFGGALWWLAIQAFLSPLVMIFYTVAFVSEETSTAAGEAGAALGGGLLIVLAFVVGLPAGLVLYLLAGKLDVDD